MPILSPSVWRPSQLIVLSVLLAACGTMLTVILHQDTTIRNQQMLIRDLYQDSAKLAHIQMEEAAKHLLGKK